MEAALHANRPLLPSKLLHRHTSAYQIVVKNASSQQGSPVTHSSPLLRKDDRCTCAEDYLPPPKKEKDDLRHTIAHVHRPFQVEEVLKKE